MSEVIGILDSGLGGYTVYHALTRNYPRKQFVFLADQAYAPYGDKSKDQIYHRASLCLEWFHSQGIRTIVIACNTISSNALAELTADFAQMNLHGIIDLTLEPIPPGAGRKIAVFATAATVNSHRYQEKICQAGMQAQEIATAYLVPMIEGLSRPEEIEAALGRDLIAIEASDCLVLGCTHYPLVRPLIEKHYHKPIYDSIDPIVAEVKTIAITDGPAMIYTSGDPNYLQKQIKALYNINESVDYIAIEEDV